MAAATRKRDLVVGASYFLLVACGTDHNVVANGQAGGGGAEPESAGGRAGSSEAGQQPAFGGSGAETGGVTARGGAGGIGQGGSSGADNAGGSGNCGNPAALRSTFTSCSQATDQGTCERFGGMWLTGGNNCECRAPDEGCPCTTLSDCLAYCVSDAQEDADCAAATTGTCSPWAEGGCYCYLDATDGKPGYLCVN